jgi:TrmH family RNA methyltransferase
LDLSRIHVVLVEAGEPMNLGAAARAMKNCGLSRLTLVAPRTLDLVTARRVAVHAEELLEAPRVERALPDAIAGARWVVGTSSRALHGRIRLGPREVAAQAARIDGEVALVFGGEQSGLSNDDLLQCHAVSAIDAAAGQPSLNLAQAVLVYAYELYALPREGGAPPDAPPRAEEGALQQVERSVEALLEASGFADPHRKGHGVRELSATLRRAALTPSEARLWVAALRGAEQRLRRGR